MYITSILLLHVPNEPLADPIPLLNPMLLPLLILPPPAALLSPEKPPFTLNPNPELPPDELDCDELDPKELLRELLKLFSKPPLPPPTPVIERQVQVILSYMFVEKEKLISIKWKINNLINGSQMFTMYLFDEIDGLLPFFI